MGVVERQLRMSGQQGPRQGHGATVAALQVDGAVFSYGERKILNGLSLSVAAGSVYALLGPSGCGKTTLLSCVLGRQKLAEGRVRLLGGKPGDRSLGLPGNLVGFMPQSTSLFMEFTISETFSYFGGLLHMTRDQIENRREKLLQLLHLPEEDRQVRTLSGGQQRRLSLAMALIHQPPILILDEPTVGVDPLVRQRVWEHILELSRDRGTTTIITTHYVEEARGAAKVGFMREGRLLAEDSPAGLLQSHCATSLEGVFLSLCQKQSAQAWSPAQNPQIVSHPSPKARNFSAGMKMIRRFQAGPAQFQNSRTSSPSSSRTGSR